MKYLEIARNVLELEAQEIINASTKLDEDQLGKLVDIFKYLEEIDGNLVFCGVGKSGVIASKLASTFCSLGLHSFFLHPVEALHGDLGRVNKTDAIVFISKSGTTEEIMKLLPFLEISPKRMVGLLGNVDSPIGRRCELVFDCSVKKEACINNQAPTTSSTLALAMGDALAVVYESIVGLSREGFAVNHPGGKLGKSLRIKVKHLMCDKAGCPIVGPGATLQDVILEMTKKPLGGCAVLDEDDKFLGFVVEGDIRRTFTKENMGLQTPVTEIFNSNPVDVRPDALALDALKLMELRKREIAILPVLDENKIFKGLIRLHDLLKEGLA
jgi:arabinose-5-phosphate isomerase